MKNQDLVTERLGELLHKATESKGKQASFNIKAKGGEVSSLIISLAKSKTAKFYINGKKSSLIATCELLRREVT